MGKRFGDPVFVCPQQTCKRIASRICTLNTSFPCQLRSGELVGTVVSCNGEALVVSVWRDGDIYEVDRPHVEVHASSVGTLTQREFFRLAKHRWMKQYSHYAQFQMDPDNTPASRFKKRRSLRNKRQKTDEDGEKGYSDHERIQVKLGNSPYAESAECMLSEEIESRAKTMRKCIEDDVMLLYGPRMNSAVQGWGKVERVVDSVHFVLTFDNHTVNCKMFGFDAPNQKEEMGLGICEMMKETMEGKRVTYYIRLLLSDYLCMDVYLEDEWLQAKFLEQGLGWVDREELELSAACPPAMLPQGKLSVIDSSRNSRLLTIEATAKEKNVGIWDSSRRLLAPPGNMSSFHSDVVEKLEDVPVVDEESGIFLTRAPVQTTIPISSELFLNLEELEKRDALSRPLGSNSRRSSRRSSRVPSPTVEMNTRGKRMDRVSRIQTERLQTAFDKALMSGSLLPSLFKGTDDSLKPKISMRYTRGGQ